MVVLALALAACSERAESPAAAPGGTGSPGQILYLTYCEGCHGVAGRGDGPAAASLRTPPTDLTQLWKRYGTPLDRERLVEYIDGRQLVADHGPSEMPAWGSEFFENAAPMAPNPEGAKRHLIRILADYLQTLQTERQL
jgi:mono/diheme cytochrome c family protein